MPPASKAESVIWAESAPLMLWLMIDEHSLITLWGYLPLGRKGCGCLQSMELQQYIIVIKKKKREGVWENQNMMSGRRWHSDYQIISLSSIFLLCARIHCFSSRLSLLIWAGGGRRASVILNQIQNEVVPGGWANTKTSLMKMNASGNLLSPGLHSGIPRDQWGHRGRGEEGRERRGGRGMACEVSPYGITVGTCIFFWGLGGVVLFTGPPLGIICSASGVCVSKKEKGFEVTTKGDMYASSWVLGLHSSVCNV